MTIWCTDNDGHENAGHEISGHNSAGHETSLEAANVWSWIDWVDLALLLCSLLRHNVSTSDVDDTDDLPSVTALPAAATGRTSTSPVTPVAVDNCCEVCLIGQRDGVALVPCGQARFCATWRWQWVLLHTATWTNYPCGFFKHTLKENIVLKHEHIRITTDCRRRSSSRDRTLTEIQHFSKMKTLRSENKASIDYPCGPFKHTLS